MINLNEEITKFKSKYASDEDAFVEDFAFFLVSNEWFDEKPEVRDNKVYVSDGFLNSPRITEFCQGYKLNIQEKADCLKQKLKDEFPQTGKAFEEYCDAFSVDALVVYHLADFLLSYLPGELALSTDREIKDLMSYAFDTISRVYDEVLSDFINWLHDNKKYHTAYYNRYFAPNYSESDNNDAYDPDYYLKIMYCFFNEDYIEENLMYESAADSKKYLDCWLFISLHFLCALRETDLVRLPHPILPIPAEDVLQQVKDGTFSDENAMRVLYSINIYLESVLLTPNKTAGTQGIGSIKFHVPVSCESHIGKLFAIAEAHFQLAGLDPAEQLIKPYHSYYDITKAMGEEIGDLFIEADFRTRSANKSFLQMIYTLSDEVLYEKNDVNHIKGYMLAALARSHKGSYGEFAQTTSRYLKDAKMSGMTPEFVARELFERGVLSSISSMLLKMISGQEYKQLSVSEQTQAIKALDMTPLQIEKSVALMQASVKQGTEIAEAVYQNNDKQSVIHILHNLGCGNAVSKQNECLCIVTAMDKLCPYPERSGCVGCKYEVGTKSTLLLMAAELRRLASIYKDTGSSSLDKAKSKSIAVNTVAPAMKSLLQCMEETYGKEAADRLNKIIEDA